MVSFDVARGVRGLRQIRDSLRYRCDGNDKRLSRHVKHFVERVSFGKKKF